MAGVPLSSSSIVTSSSSPYSRCVSPPKRRGWLVDMSSILTTDGDVQATDVALHMGIAAVALDAAGASNAKLGAVAPLTHDVASSSHSSSI